MTVKLTMAEQEAFADLVDRFRRDCPHDVIRRATSVTGAIEAMLCARCGKAVQVRYT